MNMGKIAALFLITMVAVVAVAPGTVPVQEKETLLYDVDIISSAAARESGNFLLRPPERQKTVSYGHGREYALNKHKNKITRKSNKSTKKRKNKSSGLAALPAFKEIEKMLLEGIVVPEPPELPPLREFASEEEARRFSKKWMKSARPVLEEWGSKVESVVPSGAMLSLNQEQQEALEKLGIKTKTVKFSEEEVSEIMDEVDRIIKGTLHDSMSPESQKKMKEVLSHTDSTAFGSPQALDDARIVLKLLSDAMLHEELLRRKKIAGKKDRPAPSKKILNGVSKMSHKRLKRAVRSINNMPAEDIGRITASGDVAITGLVNKSKNGEIKKLAKIIASIPGSDEALASVGGTAVLVKTLSSVSLGNFYELLSKPVFITDGRDNLYRDIRIGKFYKATCPFKTCILKPELAASPFSPDNRMLEMDLKGPVVFKEGGQIDIFGTGVATSGSQGAKAPAYDSKIMPAKDTARISPLEMNREEPSKLNGNNPYASWLYEDACLVKYDKVGGAKIPVPTKEYEDDTQLYRNAGMAFNDMMDLVNGFNGCQKIYPKDLKCFPLPYSVSPKASDAVAGAANSSQLKGIDCFPAVWKRLMVDSCTNQFITRHSFFPVSHKHLVDPDGRKPGIGEHMCQPLKTTNVYGKGAYEYRADDYLKKTFNGVMNYDYYPDIYDKKNHPDAKIKGLGISLEAGIGPGGYAESSLLFKTWHEVAKRTKGRSPVTNGTINAMATFPYERISDVYHPFSPRYDFKESDRSKYSPMTFAGRSPNPGIVLQYFVMAIESAGEGIAESISDSALVKVLPESFRKKIKNETQKYLNKALGSMGKAFGRQARSLTNAAGGRALLNNHPYGGGYDEFGDCTVRCASTPVDILKFRADAFDECIGCRIKANFKCFWGEVYQIMTFTKLCRKQFGSLNPTRWVVCVNGKYSKFYNAINSVLKDKNPINSFRHYTFASFAAASLVTGGFEYAVAYAILNVTGIAKYKCKTKRSKKGQWPMCSTKFDIEDAKDITGDCEKCKPIKECCHDLAKPLAGINILKIRSDSGQNMPEGYTFREYFGTHRPYMRWWDTGKEAGMGLWPTPDYHCPLGHMDTIIGVGREAKYTYNVVGNGGASMISEQRPAESCKIGGGAGAGFGCIPKYKVGTVDNPVKKGANSLTGWMELKLHQTRCFKEWNLNCLCQYEKIFKAGDTEDAALLVTGGEYMSSWRNDEYDDDGKLIKKGTLRSRSYAYPFSWRGYITSSQGPNAPDQKVDPSTTRFPYMFAKDNDKLPIFVGIDNALPGDILIWDTPRMKIDRTKGQYREIPKVAVVIDAQTEASGLPGTSSSSISITSIDSIKQRLNLKQMMLDMVRKRLTDLQIRFSQMLAEQNQIENEVNNMQQQAREAFDDFTKFREQMYNKMYEMRDTISVMENEFDSMFAKLRGELSKAYLVQYEINRISRDVISKLEVVRDQMSPRQVEALDELIRLRQEAEYKDAELKALEKKPASQRTPEEMRRIGILRGEAYNAYSSIYGIINDSFNDVNEVKNEVSKSKTLKQKMDDLGNAIAASQKMNSLKEAIEKRKKTLASLEAKLEQVKKSEDLKNIKDIISDINATSKAIEQVDADIANILSDAASTLGKFADVSDELKMIGDAGKKLADFGSYLKDISGLNEIKRKLGDFGELLGKLEVIKGKINEANRIKTALESQKLNLQKELSDLAGYIGSLVNIDKLEADVASGVAGAKEKLDKAKEKLNNAKNKLSSLLGTDGGEFVRVVEFNHGKIPDACGVTDVVYRKSIRTLRKGAPSGEVERKVGHSARAVAGNVLIGKLPARRATVSCIDPDMADCHEPNWDNVLVYRIREDIRTPCPALKDVVYSGTKSIKLDSNAPAGTLPPIPDCIAKGYDPAEGIIPQRTLENMLPDMQKHGNCSPEMGVASNLAGSGQAVSGSLGRGCPKFNKNDNFNFNVLGREIVAQGGKTVGVAEVPVIKNGKVMNLPCGGALNIVDISVIRLDSAIRVVELGGNVKRAMSGFFTGLVSDVLRGLLGNFCPHNFIGKLMKEAFTLVLDTYASGSYYDEENPSVYAYIRPQKDSNVTIPPWGGVEIDVTSGGGQVTLPMGGSFMSASGEVSLESQTTISVDKDGVVFLSDGRVFRVASDKPLQVDADMVIMPAKYSKKKRYFGNKRISVRNNKLIAPAFGSVLVMPRTSAIEIDISKGGGTVTLPYGGKFEDVNGEVSIRESVTLTVDGKGNILLSNKHRYRTNKKILRIEAMAVRVPPGTPVPLPKNPKIIQPIPVQAVIYK